VVNEQVALTPARDHQVANGGGRVAARDPNPKMEVVQRRGSSLEDGRGGHRRTLGEGVASPLEEEQRCKKGLIKKQREWPGS